MVVRASCSHERDARTTKKSTFANQIDWLYITILMQMRCRIRNSVVSSSVVRCTSLRKRNVLSKLIAAIASYKLVIEIFLHFSDESSRHFCYLICSINTNSDRVFSKSQIRERYFVWDGQGLLPNGSARIGF
jgi:hypothetical protein